MDDALPAGMVTPYPVEREATPDAEDEVRVSEEMMDGPGVGPAAGAKG